MHLFLQSPAEVINTASDALKTASEARDIAIILAVMVVGSVVMIFLIRTLSKPNQGLSNVLVEMMKYNGRIADAVERLEELMSGNRVDADQRFDELDTRVDRVEKKVNRLLPSGDTQEMDKI